MMILSGQVKKIVTSGVVTVGLLIVLSMPAQADGLNASSGSVNLHPQRAVLLSVGQASQSNGSLSQTLQGLGYTSISIGDDKKAKSWSLGYRHPISRHFSADIQYLQQGKTNPNVQTTLPLGKTSDQAAQETAESIPKRGQGLSAIAVYHYPLTPKLIFQAGLGAFAWESKRTASVGTSTHTAKSDGISAIFQLGFSYPITARTKLETQWQHTFMPDETVDRFSIGIAVGF